MPDRRALEERPSSPTDVVKWIDTTVMIADCLTKQMREDSLQKVIDENRWEFHQTEEARAVKARKQEQRRKATDNGEEPED